MLRFYYLNMTSTAWEISKKKVFITGSNTGIGFQTALKLAQKGSTVFIHGRDEEKGVHSLKKIVNLTENKNIEFIKADFSSFSEVMSIVDYFKEHSVRLDVLINNAGGYFPKKMLTKNNLEMTMQVNHLSPFLLTRALLSEKILSKDIFSRIINVASSAHRRAKLDVSDLMMDKKRYEGLLQYSNSKLANILFTYELAERLKNSKITVNALHPGFVRSEFLRNNKFLKYLIWLVYPFTISSEKGSETSVYLASEPELVGVSGKYFVKKRPVKSSKISYDKNLRKELWLKSEEIIKEKIGGFEFKD